MAYKIIVTRNAERDFEKVVLYIRKEWSESVVQEFTANLISKIELLSILPFIGVKSQKDSSIRRIIISKQNTLYYRVRDKRIILLNFFDNRRNPESNPYR